MTETPNIQDMTPEELQAPLLVAAKAHVPFDGWSLRALNAAADDIGVDHGMAELAFPDGPKDLLAYHLECADAALAADLAKADLEAMKIKERITFAIKSRLINQEADKELVRRGIAFMALPAYIDMGPKALWATADVMWRAAGDTSTDHNHYTKRATLSAVYSSVVLFWLQDESENNADTWAFLDRRIEDVMKIETAKYKAREASKNWPSVARFLGRLRYGD